MEIITTHTNADFDALAAAVAAQKIYPDAKIVLPGALNRNVREFLLLHDDVIDTYNVKLVEKKRVSRLIIVDNKIGRRLGELQVMADDPGTEVFAFDHHPATDEDVVLKQDFSQNVGATTTILVEIIRDRGLQISPLEATLFALGIHEDTGSLTFKTTTYADAEALAYVMLNHASLDIIHRFLNPVLTPDQHELLDTLIHAAKIINVHGTNIMITTADAIDYIEGASVVVHKLAEIENIEVVFTLLRQVDRVSIIARSRTDIVDVGKVLEDLGGGGHAQAASATIKGQDAQAAEQRLTDALYNHVRKPPVAKDIMSAPVKTVDVETTIKEANALLIRFGYSGLPVTEKGTLVGLIGRREIDKAAHHGLSHAPVKGFMMRRIEPVTPDASLFEIQHILSEENVGRVPVVTDGKVIGIISRTDVLKALGGAEYLSRLGFETAKPQYSRGEITQRIKTLLPGEVQHMLRQIGELADESGFKIYLVGGIVRDLLLNYRNLDVDIVVEGDGIAFARFVAERLNGRIRAHQKFGTAVVVLRDGFKVDFASARAEYYEKPAALPHVEPTSIRQDLARRDFTINAMAISLNASQYGQILDFFNGQRDLSSGLIRILHNLSFVEDPTRIFRGVRFEQRLGFKLEQETEALLRKAIDMELIGHLSGARVRYELIMILDEERPFRVLKRLYQLGALSIITETTTVDARLKAQFTRIHDGTEALQTYFVKRIDKRLLYLAAILKQLKREQLEHWCERMKLKKVDASRLIEMVIVVPKVAKELDTIPRIMNSQLYTLLHDLTTESIVYAYTLTGNEKVRRRIRRYLESLRGIELVVDGGYLRHIGFPPSPMYNIVLKDLLASKLNGRVKTPEDEMRFVRKRIVELTGNEL